MKAQIFILPAGLSRCVNHIRLLPETRKFRVTVEPYTKKRSIDQNAISHAWYRQISETEREYAPEQVKRICKLDYGIPILRGDSATFNHFCVRAIDPITIRQDKIDAMQFIDVTSLMTTAQFSDYLEQLQQAYAGRVDLQFPNE